ncbi:MAG: hypothetical protein P0Y65_09825 [Candidatus Devosia phytovorans]|uniref:NADH-quinone oxidoreductase subunit E n=1 Tax=Candidatus Devosia phytovorans TaxID=3121372 RepID=A0AAJ6B1Q1_9HYPH|nr:hypothetical protein [Devosia sp.]WEK06517.1 MAG: hypothetical protein P0Y65_09825 [Devosia sp.]
MFNAALMIETAVLIFAAYLIGCVIGYGLRRVLYAARGTHLTSPVVVAPKPVIAPAPTPELRRPLSPAAHLAARANEPIDEPKPLVARLVARPPALSTPRNGRADDLKLIKGIGPKIEASLNGLGIHHFDQIAGWTIKDADWIDGQLAFKGRVAREGWVEQASRLLKAAA